MTGLTEKAISRAQDRLLRLLGNAPERRAHLVAAMLKRDVREATSYWLQLVVSIGIATLGLVVGSTAVVIGAMLVAPLMGPIVGLAMGLAAGSPFLVLRASGRIAGSVLVVVAGAATITLLLPFHEMNAEIAARTAPTVLDLVTAGFCALAGVYAALRPGADTTSTAAGTAISVSLVPPLCASGYGFGTQAWSVAGGAALLFLTNLVAIIVIGTVAFVAAGFNRVPVVALERDELANDVTDTQAPIARPVAQHLSRLFASRFGPVLRFLMPFALLAAVYVPLRRALDELAWEVRARAAVRASIDGEAARVVESRIEVKHHEVSVELVLLGTASDATRARERLDAGIRQAAGVEPHLEVLAVADANAVAGLASSALSSERAAEGGAFERATPAQEMDAVRSRLRAAVESVWPSEVAGSPAAVEASTDASGAVRLRVVHLGVRLGADASEAIRRAAKTTLARDVEIEDAAVPAHALTRKDGDLALVASTAAAVADTAGVPSISVCVVRPPPPALGSRASRPDTELAVSLDAVLRHHPRVTTMGVGDWSIRFVDAACDAAPASDTTTAAAPSVERR